MFAYSMGFSDMADSNGVTTIFVTWPEVTACNQTHAFAGGRP